MASSAPTLWVIWTATTTTQLYLLYPSLLPLSFPPFHHPPLILPSSSSSPHPPLALTQRFLFNGFQRTSANHPGTSWDFHLAQLITLSSQVHYHILPLKNAPGALCVCVCVFDVGTGEGVQTGS